MTDRPNSRYRADTDVNQINQTKPALLLFRLTYFVITLVCSWQITDDDDDSVDLVQLQRPSAQS